MKAVRRSVFSGSTPDRYGWLGPDGGIPAVEVGSRQAFHYARGQSIAFVVVTDAFIADPAPLPTPDTSSSSACVRGRRCAISISVRSLKTMYAGTPFATILKRAIVEESFFQT